MPSPPPPPIWPPMSQVALAQGWNLLSFPVAKLTKLEPGTGVLEGAFYWDPVSGGYQLLDLLDLAGFNSGEGTNRGFWFFATEPSVLEFAGTGACERAALKTGWNLLGFPEFQAGQVVVTAPGAPAGALLSRACPEVTPPEGCLLHRYAFAYDSAQGAYRVVDLGAAETTAEAGSAAWVFAHGEATLDFAAQASAGLYIPSAYTSPGGQGEIRILATAAEPVAGFDLTLTWDPAVIAISPASLPGSVDTYQVRGSTADGSARVLLTSAVGQSFLGTEVLRIPFTTLPGAPVGTSALNVTGEFWGDAATRLATPAAGAGSVVVQSATGSSEASAADFGVDVESVRLQIPAHDQNDPGIYESTTLYNEIHVEACKVTDYFMVKRVFDSNARIRSSDWVDGQGAAYPPWPRADVGILRDQREAIKSWLRDGKPLVAGTNTYPNHWVLIVGFDGDQILAHDPWGGNGYVPIQNTLRYRDSWLVQSLNVTVPKVNPGCSTEIGCNSSEKSHFQACFDRNGGAATVGCPIDAGGTVCTHWIGNVNPVVIQDFDGGSGSRGAIIDNEGTGHSTAYWIHGAIWQAYLNAGGPDGPLGRPQSDEIDAVAGSGSPNGTTGRLNWFDNGAIYWSGAHGAHPVYGDISRQFEAQGGTTGGLGFPVSDPYEHNGALQQNFEGGTLREGASVPINPEVGCNSSHQQHFVDAWVRGGGGAVVGAPIDGGGGKCTHWWGTVRPVVIQDFNGGSAGRGAIIDNEGVAHTKAWWLHGAIWDKYAAWGGPDCPLGRPTSDEFSAARSPQGTEGRVQRFEDGSIYHSSRYGSFPVYGMISDLYEAEGGTNSFLGFPKSDRHKVNGISVQDFEGGSLDINVAPNAPSPSSPTAGSILASRSVTFQWTNKGDPDNGPSPLTFQVRLLDASGNYVTSWQWLSGTSYQASVPSDGHWRWAMQAYDGFEKSPVSSSVAFTVDTAAPTVPTGLTATTVEGTRVSLSWTASTDSLTGIQNYVLRRDGVAVSTPTETSLVDEGLTPGRTYIYTVAARDGAGNTSAVSTSLSVTTTNQPPGAPAPTAPQEGQWLSDRSVTMTWTDGGDPDTAPEPTRTFAVEVLRADGTPVQDSGWLAQTLWAWLAPSDGLWKWTVRAFDGHSESPRSAGRTFGVDTVAPTVPTNLQVASKTPTAVVLTWDASDDVLSGLQRYELDRDGTPLLGDTQATYSDTGLAPGATYNYRVAARDVAGNLSLPSDPLAVTLPEEDYAPGDVDGDGQVTVADLNLLLDNLLGLLDLAPIQLRAADMNGDGTLDLGDGIRWLRR